MRSARWLLASAVFTASFAASTLGQDAAAWRDSAQRLQTLAKALRDSMVRGDSTTQEIARSGNLVIAASSDDRAIATAALRQFVELSERWFGGAMPSPGGFRIVVRTEAVTSAGIGRPREVGAVVLAGMPDTGASERIQRTTSPADLTRTLIDGYGELMFASANTVSLWLHFVPALSAPEPDRRMLAMYALVTGTGRGQRECTGGDVHACAYALVLRQPPPGVTVPVFPVSMRADLLFTALTLGGTQAWTRLRDAEPAGLEAALAAAAAMPIDSLLSRWRAGLLALRPANGPINTGGGLAALVWSAAVLLAALGASRWA